MQRSYLFLPVKSLWSLGLCVTSAKSKASHGLYTSFPCTLLISWHFISRTSYIEDFKLMKRRPFWKLSRFMLFSSLIPLRRAIKESTYCSSGLSRAMHSSRCAIKGLDDDLGRCSAWPQHLRSSHTTAGSSKARSTWPTAPKPAHYDGQPHRLLTMMDNPKIGSRHSWQAILWVMPPTVHTITPRVDLLWDLISVIGFHPFWVRDEDLKRLRSTCTNCCGLIPW